jgi:hypothetical protein
MRDIEIFEQRRAARQNVSARDSDLMRLHEFAADTLENLDEAQKVLERALLQVSKWETNELCSPGYISAWRAILHLPNTALRKAMLRSDADGVALRRNTPFGFLLERL